MRQLLSRLPLLAGGCALFLLLALPAQAAMDIRSGHAGHWYAPDRDGEGWVLELRDAGDAWLYWFTYDDDGNQRWLTAHGQIVVDDGDGQRIDFQQLVVSRGARFGDDFDPDDVVREAVGSASLRFDDCDNGQFSYSAYGQTQAIPVQRLARVMGARCQTVHGVTGNEVADHAGQSGSWYDPTHNGEGYALHWTAPDQAIVTWYSYDDQGGQYWMLGVGQFDGEGRIHFPDVHATRGARFGSAFDPDDVERFEWGTLTFELTCDGGSAHYESVLPAFGSGDFQLSRLTSLDEIACPWQRPALTDLYGIDLVELPTAIDGDDGAVHRIGDVHVDDDGSLWAIVQFSDATRGLRVARLAAGDEAWSLVGDIVTPRLRAPSLFVRGDQVFANARDDKDTIHIVVWDGTDWQPLPSPIDGAMAVTGVSADGTRLVGIDPDTYDSPWMWNVEDGVVELTTEHASGHSMKPIPRFTSNDGSHLFGFPHHPRPRVASYTAFALSWTRPDELDYLPSMAIARPAAPGTCADDCRVLFGAVSTLSLPNVAITPPRPRHEPWYWRSDGRSGFMGSMPSRPGARHIVSGAAADGNTVVGTGGTFIDFSAGTQHDDAKTALDDDLRVDGFIWMPDVGMTEVSQLLADAGFALPPLDYLNASAISADGRTVFLDGIRPQTASPDPSGSVLALLVLTPHEAW